MSLLETLRKASADGDVDFLREGVRILAQAIMEAEVSELTGVAKGERDPERRLTHRNGYRERRWDTRVGTIDLAIPRVRDGSYFPCLLEPRRRTERACSRSSRRPTSPASAPAGSTTSCGRSGIDGISKSEVSRMCAALDAEVEAFRHRPLTDDRASRTCGSTRPTSRSARQGRVVSMAALVATGRGRSGERRVLGLELSAGNDEGSAWPAFIRGLVERGLHGVRLVISDDHPGS